MVQRVITSYSIHYTKLYERDAVTDREHLSDFGRLRVDAKIRDLLFQNGGDFRGADSYNFV